MRVYGIVVLALSLASCGKSQPSCIEGQSSACACPNGSNGAQVCAGGAYGACTCNAPAPAPTPPAPVTTQPVAPPTTASNAPSGYQCGAGKPVAGSGCTCPAGTTPARDDENIALC